MCPVCLTDRWPFDAPKHLYTFSQNHRSAHRAARTHMLMDAQRHTASRITWGSCEKSCTLVSYMQAHASAHRCTHTRIHGHSHCSQNVCPACTHTCGQPHISLHLHVLYMFMQITHLSLHAHLHCTFNPETVLLSAQYDTFLYCLE